MSLSQAQALANPHGDFYGFEDLLSEQEKQVLARARVWLVEHVVPAAQKAWDEAEFFDASLLKELKELDLLSPVRRLGHSELLAGLLTAEYARTDVSFATFLGVHDGLFIGSIELLASEEQKEQWLPAYYSLERIGAFGLTEPLGGSDVAGGLRTTARREGDAWILNGAKRWIGNATWCDDVIIYAKDEADGQVKAFLVDTSSKGYSASKIENKIALRTVQNADITLESVRVEESRRLQGCNSFKDVNKVLRSTRLGVAWQGVGVQMAAFDIARQYALDRTQFGKPLASYQMVQERLVSILGNATASKAMMAQLSQIEQSSRTEDSQSALAKAYVSARMRESVATARALLGGNGIVTDYQIARFFNDAEAIYTYEGTYEINTLVVGRAVTGVSAIL